MLAVNRKKYQKNHTVFWRREAGISMLGRYSTILSKPVVIVSESVRALWAIVVGIICSDFPELSKITPISNILSCFPHRPLKCPKLLWEEVLRHCWLRCKCSVVGRGSSACWRRCGGFEPGDGRTLAVAWRSCLSRSSNGDWCDVICFFEKLSLLQSTQCIRGRQKWIWEQQQPGERNWKVDSGET